MKTKRRAQNLLAGLLASPLVALALGGTPALAQETEVPDGATIAWDARAVEHLWNRAGFGIAPEEIQGWVDAGQDALIDHLFALRPLEGHAPIPDFEYDEPRFDRREYASMGEDAKRKQRQKVRQRRNAAFREFRANWVSQILNGDDPLRDRMTLFWHGLFTSSYQTVKHPGLMADQHETLRDGALGSYGQLLRDMLEDPAMLRYLDNDKNRKGRPNENLAREVMELFSLGEGNYTEKDVQEAARALTGAGVANPANGGTYRFFPRRHDKGEKTILGVEGRHRPEHLASILLDQPACATYIAGRIIEYLEGVEPSPERVAAYAEVLRSTDHDVGALLRRLFRDPAFYRPEVVGARIASPVDYVVGMAVRTGADVPPHFVIEATKVLGQELFQPPTVKGWDEGLAWITTSTFMLRGNIAGAVLGQISPETIRADALEFVKEMAESDEMDMEMSPREMRAMGRKQLQRDAMTRLVRLLFRDEFVPARDLAEGVRASGATTDLEVARALCARLLAIEPPPETLRLLAGRLGELRAAKGLDEKRFAGSMRRAEGILAELAHLCLSLPEAQLH